MPKYIGIQKQCKLDRPDNLLKKTPETCVRSIQHRFCFIITHCAQGSIFLENFLFVHSSVAFYAETNYLIYLAI